MDSTCWYRYARHCAKKTPWIVQRPNKRIFAGERRKELSQKATKVAIFIMIIAAFWFAFFQFFIGTFQTETYVLASASTSLLSLTGKGNGILERFLK